MHSRVDNTRTSLAGGYDSIGPLLLVGDSREDSRDEELLENISVFIPDSHSCEEAYECRNLLDC